MPHAVVWVAITGPLAIAITHAALRRAVFRQQAEARSFRALATSTEFPRNADVSLTTLQARGPNLNA